MRRRATTTEVRDVITLVWMGYLSYLIWSTVGLVFT